MTEQEIYDACRALQIDAAARGLKYPSAYSGIYCFVEPERKAYVRVSGKEYEFKAEAPTFAEAFAQLRETIANHVPDEERLSAILGYSEQFSQAAE